MLYEVITTPDIFITSEALYQLSYAGLLPLRARRPILEKCTTRCNSQTGNILQFQPGTILHDGIQLIRRRRMRT